MSNQNRLVRVTARVPESAQPGVYTSALFVQERPPVTPPKRGQQLLYFRYRYVVTVYVIVAPVTRQGELTDLRFISDARGDRIECELTNTGSRHLRPYVTWFIRSGDREIVAIKDVEASVLLPSLKTRETLVLHELHEPLPAGEYEVEVQVDFHDGRPIQSMKRGIAGEISSLK